jgi:hypothetical protein
MKIELILIAIVAMAASLSAYAAEDTDESVTAQSGYQQGLCTVTQRKI